MINSSIIRISSTSAYVVYVCVCVCVCVCVFYLLQSGVWDAVAGDAQLAHLQVQFFEEQGEGAIFGARVG